MASSDIPGSFPAGGGALLQQLRGRSWQELDPAHLARAFAVNAIGSALLMKDRLRLAAPAPVVAAGRLLDVIDGLTPPDSGGFFDHQGARRPW